MENSDYGKTATWAEQDLAAILLAKPSLIKHFLALTPTKIRNLFIWTIFKAVKTSYEQGAYRGHWENEKTSYEWISSRFVTDQTRKAAFDFQETGLRILLGCGENYMVNRLCRAFEITEPFKQKPNPFVFTVEAKATSTNAGPVPLYLTPNGFWSTLPPPESEMEKCETVMVRRYPIWTMQEPILKLGGWVTPSEFWKSSVAQADVTKCSYNLVPPLSDELVEASEALLWAVKRNPQKVTLELVVLERILQRIKAGDSVGEKK